MHQWIFQLSVVIDPCFNLFGYIVKPFQEDLKYWNTWASGLIQEVFT